MDNDARRATRAAPRTVRSPKPAHIGAIAYAALVSLLAPTVSPAQPPAGALTEDAFLAPLPVVLSATRLRQPLDESPAAVTVIDRQMIEASGALNIPDVLRLVPGFQVGHVYGHRIVATYHGLSDQFSRRMQVLVDGRSVYTPAFGGVVWSDIPLAIEDVDRIEVIRGPNGVTYGANAFSAVVNIVTRLPTQDSGAYVTHARDHDLGLRRTIARYAGGGERFRYRVTAGRHEDEGSSSVRFPDGQRSSLLTFRGDYQTDAQNSVDMQLGALSGPRDGGDRNDVLDPPHHQQIDANFQQLRFRRVLAADEDVIVQFYHQYHRSGETYRAPIATATINEDLTTERYDVELQHTFRAGTATRIVWGGEARLDRLTAPGYFGTPDTIETRLYRVFGNAEWRPATDWIANLGAMYEHNSVTDGDVSPRAALNHHLLPDHTVRASYSRAWRTPSVVEARGDWFPCNDAGTTCNRIFLANTRLSPERIDAYELGYLGSYAERRLTVDVKIFYDEIRDVISIPTDNSGGDRFLTFRNAGEADVRGWETQLDWRPRDGTRVHLAHAYAHQRGRVQSETNPVTFKDTRQSTPVHTTSLLAIQRLPYGFEASAAWYRQSSILWLDQGGEDDTTGRRWNYDLRLAYRLRGPDLRGSIEIVGQNVRGSFFDYQDDVLFDRRYYLRLSLELP